MRERLLADWPLKTLSLVLAFAIWVSITGQDLTLRDFVVPLEIECDPQLIPAAPPPTVVTVRLEGPRSTIRRIDPLRLAARVTVSDGPAGVREVPLSVSQLSGVPRGVDVRFDPDRLRLVLARRGRRSIEIVPDLSGAPRAGYAVYGFAVHPSAVVVEGPQMVVDTLARVRTSTIPLEHHSESFVTRTGLVPEDPRVHVREAGEVEVEVWIDTAPTRVNLTAVPVVLPFAPSGPARIQPGSVAVVLEGPPRIVEQLKPTQISAVVEVESREPQRVEGAPLHIELHLPEAQRRVVRVLELRPDRASVQLVGRAGDLP